MFRSLIALTLAFVIAISGIVKPAYADSRNLSSESANSHMVVNNQGDGNSVNISGSFNSVGDNTPQEKSNPFLDGVIRGVMETGGLVIGGAVVCYGIDGIAALLFPPAAALSALCPTVGMGNVLSSGNLISQGAKAVIGTR